MKKSFTFLFIFSLLLTVFSALPAKADQEISFAIPNGGWSWGNQTDDCAGNFNNNHVVNQGAFVWSGGHDAAVKRIDDTWTGVGSGSKCCTRNLVPFAASTYTITLVTKRLSDNVTMTLPTITIQQGTPSTRYAATAQWDKDGVLQTEDVSSSHQFYYTDGSDKKSRDKEVTLTYNNVEINAAGNYQISIDFPSGDKEKYQMKTLTIISSNPSYNVTVTADGSKGSVSGAGLKEQGSLVELSVSEEEGYAFNGWTSVSGVDLTGHLNDNPLSFTMPGNAVSLTADFTTTTCSKSKVIQCEDYDSGLSKPSEGGNLPSGLEPSTDQSGYQGTGYALFRNCTGEMYFLVNLPASTYTFTVICQNGGDKYLKLYNSEGTQVGSGYQLTSSDWGGSWQTKTTSSYVLSAGNYYIGLSANNSWAAFDQITITASTNVFCSYSYNITMADGVNGGKPTADKASAEEGETVTVTAGEPASGYYFSGWSASPTVTFSDASVSPATFSMPASDVTITANYAALVSSTFTYTTSGSGSITCATASGSSVESGTPISMTAVPSTDYVFTGWTATAGTFSDESTLTTTFTMPAEAATVTANFAQVDNVIVTGGVTTISDVEYGGEATMVVTSVPDFDAFNHNVLKFAYSDMNGKYKGQKVSKNIGYSSASSAGATGFGFYYKTEKADDHVAFCFDTRSGQVKWQLAATNNVWKYVYIPRSEANSWSNDGIIIYMNGSDNGNYGEWKDQPTSTSYPSDGAFYMSEIAATSITSKPDIDTYHYTYNRGNEMQVNDYGTLCLPMAGTIAGATLYSIAGKEVDGGTTYIVLEDKGTAVEAGKPYITQSTATSYTVTMGGVHSDVQAGNGLVGTYTEIVNLTPYDESNKNYVLWNNKIMKAGTGITVGAYRAYLNLDAVPAYSPASPAPGAKYVRMAIEGTDIQTGIETVNGEWVNGENAKILRGGHLFILRDGKTYNAQGQMIK